jgi:hypothetical protein
LEYFLFCIRAAEKPLFPIFPISQWQVPSGKTHRPAMPELP